MRQFLLKIFRVYPDEMKLLLWIVIIQFTMRVSSVLINNYAQTAFLKRYGVEYLPTVFLINAILVFVIINILGVLMDRYRATRVFTGILLFFAASVGLIWMLIPLNITALYPILFILKTEASGTLPLLYWNIMNNLFTSRQAKRLFTLITAGGIFGSTLGNLLTGNVAEWVGVDNVMLIFVVGMVLAALMNERIEWITGAPIQARTDRRKKKHGSLKEIFTEVYDYSKRSSFLKFMIVIMAIPNLVLPILVYQFNVVVDLRYATEEATIEFFGRFRGIANLFIFFTLMFSGRILSRWGVATGLLFHPINYLGAFASLFFRFDIFAGVYARFSTEALKTAINNPARAVLYNFFPPHVRGKIQVFLRGTVVKVAALLGSGLLLATKGFLEPQMLSLVAAPLVLIWIFTNIVIKRRYASMVIQVLMDRQIDWSRLENVNLKQLARDKRTLDTLQRGLQAENPDIVILCAEILAQVAPQGWATWILNALPGNPPATQGRLLAMLKPEDADEVLPGLISLAQESPADTLTHLIPAIARLDPSGHLQLLERLSNHPDVRVQIQALVALYGSEDQQARMACRQRVQKLIEEGDPHSLETASKILSETGDPSFSEILLRWVESKEPEFVAPALSGLSKMHVREALEFAEEVIDDPSPEVRRAAAQVMIDFGEDETPLDKWVHLLADEDPEVRANIASAIRHRGEGAAKSLIPALASPSMALRNEVLAILDEFEAPPLELSQFITRELERAYQHLAYIKSLQAATNSRPAISLLIDHLFEKNEEILETVLRVLAVQEFGDRMEIIRRALQTANKRDVDNAIEALESSLHTGIRKTLIPLLEDSPLEEKLDIGLKTFTLEVDGSQPPTGTLKKLLVDNDPITQIVALFALSEGFAIEAFEPQLVELADSKNSLVRETLQWTRQQLQLDPAKGESPEDGLPLLQKVLHIRKISMFANLRVRELVAIANIARERQCAEGEVVVKEGDQGDVLYLIVEGDLSIIKGKDSEREMLLDRIKADDFFGEMALFDYQPRAATVVTDSDTRLLFLEGEAFTRLMEHHPAIPIDICRVLSQRTRTLHERFRSHFS